MENDAGYSQFVSEVDAKIELYVKAFCADILDSFGGVIPPLARAVQKEFSEMSADDKWEAYDYWGGVADYEALIFVIDTLGRYFGGIIRQFSIDWDIFAGHKFSEHFLEAANEQLDGWRMEIVETDKAKVMGTRRLSKGGEDG